MVRPITGAESYFCETGKSMKVPELTISQNGCWRKHRYYTTNPQLVESTDTIALPPSGGLEKATQGSGGEVGSGRKRASVSKRAGTDQRLEMNADLGRKLPGESEKQETRHLPREVSGRRFMSGLGDSPAYRARRDWEDPSPPGP
jgi:hypothetical protein